MYVYTVCIYRICMYIPYPQIYIVFPSSDNVLIGSRKSCLLNALVWNISANLNITIQVNQRFHSHLLQCRPALVGVDASCSERVVQFIKEGNKMCRTYKVPVAQGTDTSRAFL